MRAKKPMGQHATREMGPELTFDEARHGHTAIPRTGQEGLEFFSEDLMKKRLLGLAACAFDMKSSAET